jgi:hypothetical protein
VRWVLSRDKICGNRGLAPLGNARWADCEPTNRGRFDNVFFPGMSLVILAVVFTGFARTYYLAGVFHAPVPNLLVHIHGAVFSVWPVLMLAQVSLVAVNRLTWHRSLAGRGKNRMLGRFFPSSHHLWC